MLKVAFIGAGGRGRSAHYPSVNRLKDVSIEAVAELDESLMRTVVEEYNIPRSFKDYREMLATVDLDIVYCIMNERFVTPIAIDCMNAGKHIAIEKPPRPERPLRPNSCWTPLLPTTSTAWLRTSAVTRP